MHSWHFVIIVLISISLAVTSCSPSYVTNSHNVPLFDHAKEFAGSVNYGISGTELQAAYAITDHLAVMANGQAKWYNGATPRGNNFFGEAGVGYFGNLYEHRAEIFAGYGAGNSLAWNATQGLAVESHGPRIKTAFDRIFIQPSIATNGERLKIIFTTRFSFVNFKSVKVLDTITDDNGMPPINYQAYLGPQVIIEPSVTGRFPVGKVVYGFVQAGMNFQLDNIGSPVVYASNVIHLSAGVQIRMGRK